jgi:hypothetical protein
VVLANVASVVEAELAVSMDAPGVGLLRTEMERVLTLLGCRSLEDLGPHLIRS